MVWFVELVEGALFVPLLDGAVLVPEVEGVAGAALVDGLLIELGAGALFVPLDEVLLEGAAFIPLEEALLAGAPVVPLDEVLAAEGEPDAHFSCAAWVFGPITPSIAPGSQPWSFSCCCSCFTDSSPFGADIEVEALAEAASGPGAAAALVPEEPLVLEAVAPLVELDAVAPLVLLVAPLVELIEDAAGDCGCVAEASADDFDAVSCWPAVAERAAITAAAIAIFFSSMVDSF